MSDYVQSDFDLNLQKSHIMDQKLITNVESVIPKRR